MDVKLQLEKEECLIVYIADMKDPCILGMDYHRCLLDSCTMQLTDGKRNVLLRNVEY